MYLSKELLFLLANNKGGIIICNNPEEITSYELSTTSDEPVNKLIKDLRELGCYGLVNKTKSDNYILHKSVNIILDRRLHIMIIVVFYNINDFLDSISKCDNFIEYLYGNMIGLPLDFKYNNIHGKKGKVIGVNHFIDDYSDTISRINNKQHMRAVKSDITKRVISYYSDLINIFNS